MVMLIFDHPQIQVIPIPVIVGRRSGFIFFSCCLHDGIVALPLFSTKNTVVRSIIRTTVFYLIYCPTP